MRGAFLCCPPPCPIRIRGRVPAAPSGVHSTPGISPSAKSCSKTPSDVLSEVKRIAFQAFRDASCGHSLGHEEEGVPTCHRVNRSHLLSSRRLSDLERITTVLDPRCSTHCARPTVLDPRAPG